MKNGFWRGKNVFVTGINGFIGGNLAKGLLAQEARVVGLLRNKNEDTLLYFEKLAGKVTLIDGDLCDKELMERIIVEERIDCVFHLAAQVEVGVGMANPYLTCETNIRGTYTLLEAVRQFAKNIKAVVVASTDKAYGSYGRDMMPYKEDYPLKPRYPYDTSKACADMLARAYASDVYRLPIVVTRFCNIFGPGQLNFSAIVPDAITSAQGYTEFIPRGDGSQIRDFIYVEDVIELYLTMGEALAKDPRGIAGEVFNAGTNSPISVRRVVEQIYNMSGDKKGLARVLSLMKGKKTVGEIDCQYMDFEKVNKIFGWKPRHDFKAGLQKTYRWFERYNEHRFRARQDARR
ncbi:MAG: GDP-mannose 4,6-dehydratase [Elusimicrobia bacterium]|nr:GDP-mannose 4,6-dehydratase [Elusimicrobiota bacterium]